MVNAEKQRKVYGERLRAKRLAHGLTQQQLADKVGSSRVSVNKWEQGVSTPMKIYQERMNRMLGKV
ncbi:helix-turn-helix domain-containing protein [Candidatus Dependentiae bacterium]|nr:helix-turn-helix domain-containing protein [Candidatus Dependentiae bacterium]